MLRILRSNQPIAFAVTPVTVLILMLVYAFVDVPPIDSHQSPSWLLGSFSSLYTFFGEFNLLLSALVIALNGILFNRMFVRHEIIPHRNSLAGWWYVLLMMSGFLSIPFSPILIAQTFTILGINQALKVYRENDGASSYFSAGFLLGCASVCSGPFIFLGIALIASVLYTRAANWRELSLPIIGFALPFLQFGALLWLSNTPVDTFLYGLNTDSMAFTWGISKIVRLAMLVLAGFIGFLFLLGTFGSSSNKSKNSKAILMLFSIGFFVVAGTLSSYSMFLALQAAAMVCAWFIPWLFIDSNKRWINIAFLMLVMATLFPLVVAVGRTF